MKIILNADVKGQGKKGQLVDVSDGYARNYLFPRNLAIQATADNLNAMKLKDKAAMEKEEHEKRLARKTADELGDKVVRVQARSGSGGKLFGSVTAQEVADALREQHGIELDKHKIVLEEPIKQMGSYEIRVKLGYEISGTLYVVVTE